MPKEETTDVQWPPEPPPPEARSEEMRSEKMLEEKEMPGEEITSMNVYEVNGEDIHQLTVVAASIEIALALVRQFHSSTKQIFDIKLLRTVDILQQVESKTSDGSYR